METTTEQQGFSPFSPEFLANPYPFYALLRRNDPVHWNQTINIWILTRYEDMLPVLRDDELFSADRRRSENFQQLGVDPDDVPRSMLTSDPPDHTRLRTLVNKAFTARTVARLRERIQQLVDGSLDRVAGRGHMEVISDLAYPLPITVIAEMLGVPADDQDRFRAWSSKIAVALGPLTSQEMGREAMEARNELIQYFNPLIERRRAEPQDDLISALIEAEEQGDALTHGELLAMLLLLLIAGHETTVNLKGNGLLALLRHPEQAQRLREDPSIAKPAVEELLRYDSPVQLTGRVAMEDLEIGGRKVKARQSVMTVVAAANRDPAVFPEPDALDLTRTPCNHLSFSAGIHFCLGAQLARIEGQIALSTIVRRFPEIRLAKPVEELTYRPAVVLRGLDELPVEF